MQTLSRYFVAFLLILVSHFLGDTESEKETSQAYQTQTETQKAPAEKIIVIHATTRCS